MTPDPDPPALDAAARDLDRLALEFGTDKCTQPVGDLAPKGYTVHYARYLAPLRDRPIRLLEIGVMKGASMKLWEAYFPQARIFGLDINPDCAQYATDRTRIFIGDQTDRDFLRSVVAEVGGPLDVVIDDGGHMMSQHLVSLEELLPHIAPGGIYAIEDLHTAYRAEYEGGYRREDSTIEFLKGLVDHVNRADRIHERSSLLRRTKARLAGKVPERLTGAFERVESVHFHKSIAFLLLR